MRLRLLEVRARLARVVAALLTSGPRAVHEAKKLARERPAGEETARIAARLRTGDEGQEGLRAFLEHRPARLDDGTTWGVYAQRE